MPYQEGEIGIKDIASGDLLQAVTRQLSNKGNTQIKDANGTARNFVIGRGDGMDTIEIEEEVQTDPANYGKFTADQLKKAFTYTSAPTMASSNYTLTNASLNDCDAITIGSTTYKFTEDGANSIVKIGADANETLNVLKDKMGSTYTVTVEGNKITVAAKAVTDDATCYQRRWSDSPDRRYRGFLLIQLGTVRTELFKRGSACASPFSVVYYNKASRREAPKRKKKDERKNYL